MAHVISALPLTTEESEADWSSRNCSSVLRGFFPATSVFLRLKI